MSQQKAAIYARYSSDLQNPRSIEDQINACLAMAERHDWLIPNHYTDSAVSGATTHRPGYQQLLQDAMRQAFDVVLVEHLDRLTRNQAEAARLFEELSFRGIEIWTVSSGNRLSEINIAFDGAMNALYLKELANKTRRGLKGKVESQLSAGGKSFGYKPIEVKDPRGKSTRGGLEIVPDAAGIVRRIFKAYAAGQSPKGIAKALNDEGIPAPRAAFWRQSTINGNRQRGTGILNNELYIGKLIWNRLRYIKDPQTQKRVSRLNPIEEWFVAECPHLRVIDDELWNAVKARQAKRDAKVKAQKETSQGASKRSGIGAARYNLTLFNEFMTCGICGGRMTAGGGRYVRCSTANETGGSACRHTKNHQRARIEERVLSALSERLMQPEALDAFLQAFNAQVDEIRASLHQEQSSRDRRLQELSRKIDNLTDVIADGGANTVLLEKLDRLTDERTELETQMNEPKPEPIHLDEGAAIALYQTHIQDLTKALSDPEIASAARESLGELIERITVSPTGDKGPDAFTLEVSGNLASLLTVSGIEKRAADSIESATRSEVSGQLVAGAGFEPATFRL